LSAKQGHARPQFADALIGVNKWVAAHHLQLSPNPGHAFTHFKDGLMLRFPLGIEEADRKALNVSSQGGKENNQLNILAAASGMAAASAAAASLPCTASSLPCTAASLP
jgi:hypothetical protein